MKRLFVLLAILTIAVSCKKDNKQTPEPSVAAETSEVRVNPVFNGEALQLDHTYSLNDTTDIQIVELKFYMSNITSAGVQKKDYALFDYRATGSRLFSFNGSNAGFTDFTALVGVPSSVNHSDPSAFPEGSALSTLVANDMYWGWSGGFIFVKIEAKADTIADGIANFDHNLVYHVATDGFTESVSFPSLNWQGTTAHVANLGLDIRSVFNRPGHRIEVRTEHTTPHMPAPEGSLTAKILGNFIAALSVQ